MFIFLFSIHFLTCTVGGGGGPVKLKKYAPKIGGGGRPPHCFPPYAPRLRCLYFSSKLEEESPQWYMTGMRHAL